MHWLFRTLTFNGENILWFIYFGCKLSMISGTRQMFNRSTTTAVLSTKCCCCSSMSLLWLNCLTPAVTPHSTHATHMPVQGSTRQMEIGMKIIMQMFCFFVCRSISLLWIPVNVGGSIVVLTAKKAWNASSCRNQTHKVLFTTVTH